MNNISDKEAMPTDAEILEAFKNTNFGRTDYKNILVEGVKKTAIGQHNGWTLTQIIRNMGLGRVSADHEKNLLTEKGLKFIEKAAYESCLSEFEQVAIIQNGNVLDDELCLANLNAIPNNTPLFTRKG
jgi:hypothetical protein